MLRVRRVQERQALADVARAEAAVRQAQDAADARARDRLAWTVPLGVPLDAAGLRSRQLQALALHDNQAAALADVMTSRSQRDASRQRWSQTRVALRSVERLAEHRAAVAAAFAAARAQAETDELALQRRAARTSGPTVEGGR